MVISVISYLLHSAFIHPVILQTEIDSEFEALFNICKLVQEVVSVFDLAEG
jgi:hypothetical protein